MNRLILSISRLCAMALCAFLISATIFGQTQIGIVSVGPAGTIFGPQRMVINPATNKAYVFDSVSADVIDLTTNKVIGAVPMPLPPPSASPGVTGSVFVNPAKNRIFVFRGNQFVTIDGSTDTVINTFSLPDTGPNYAPVAYNAAANKFYIGEIDSTAVIQANVRILDGDTFATLAQITRPDVNGTDNPSENPFQILVNPGNNLVYVIYQISGTQIIDGTSNSIVAEAACSTSCNGLAIPTQNGGAMINPADNSVWIISSGFLPTPIGGEDGAGTGLGLTFTKFYRVDGTTNEVTSPILIPGIETNVLGFDPATGFMYMMADDLPTVVNPTLSSPVVSDPLNMLVVLDPNNATPTAADPSPMKRITVDPTLLANTGGVSPCGNGIQSFEPIALDFTGGFIYWRCDATVTTFSSIVVSKMSFTDISNVNYSQLVAQLPTTAGGQLSAYAVPVAESNRYDIGSNIGPNHAALIFSTGDNQLYDVNPAAPSLATIPLGAQPAGIAVDPASSRAYVTDLTSRVMTVFDTQNFTVSSRPLAPGGSLIAASGANQYVLAGPSDPTADPNQVNGAFLFDGASNAIVKPLQGAATAAISVNPATNIGYFIDTNLWFAVDLTGGTRLYSVSDLTAAGTDRCQMSGISVNKQNNQVFVAGNCAAGGNTLAVFDGSIGARIASVNVDAIIVKIGRLIVNPNTNIVYVEATNAAAGLSGATVEFFDGNTLAHTNSVAERSGPFAVNTVTNMVYSANSIAGVAAIDGMAPEQTSFFGSTWQASGIAVDEVSNLVYMTTYNTFLGYGPNTTPVYGKTSGTLIGFHQDPATYAVVGQIFSGGVGQTGITATITGTNFTWSFVTGSNGIFTTRVAPGTYTVTLSNPAFEYSPASLTFTVGQIDLHLPVFNATPIFHVTGTILTQAGAPVSGVTINATGANGSSSAVTGSTGQYSLAGLPAGTYTVTPASPVNFYSPASESVQVKNADVAAPTFTVNPSLQIVSFTVSSPRIGAGSNATGTITINEVAPKGGIAIALASSDTKTVKPPTTLTIAAGASSGSFNFTGSGTATVTLTASYSGTLAVAPTSATTQVSVVGQDTVKVTSASWSTSTQQLNVTATGTNPQAVLTVTLASNGQTLGTMTSQGNGTFTLQVQVATRPSSVNVKSNLGGSTGQGVSVLP
jgi:DNA-binding beta-propeller fold protein YncE